MACSSFNPNANPKTGAISICLVGLQMQAYLNQQLNESEFVKKNVGKAVKMRVGIHTGKSIFVNSQDLLLEQLWEGHEISDMIF